LTDRKDQFRKLSGTGKIFQPLFALAPYWIFKNPKLTLKLHTIERNGILAI